MTHRYRWSSGRIPAVASTSMSPAGNAPAAVRHGLVSRARAVPPVDVVLIAVVTLATFVVHDVGYLLRLPFWTDEAWVAISTKLPLHQLLRVTASTPVGWSLLLRMFPFGGEQGLRLVPLGFAALTVAAAYVFARTLPWRSTAIARLAAVLSALAALLIPSALMRDDLKQYTADAFVTVLVLYATSRVEAQRSRGRLVGLAVLVVVGFLFSAVAAFVGAAAFAGLLLVAVARSQWRSALEIAVTGGAAGMLLGTVFLLLYRPGTPPGLHTYWSAYYVPVGQGWDASWHFLSVGFHTMAGYLGMGPLALVGLIFFAGVASTAALGRTAVALAVPLLVVEMVVLSAAGQYPLFDLRTSHFLTTALAVTAAVGVAQGCALLTRWHPAAPVVAAVVVGAVFLSNVRADLRGQPINQPSSTTEDLRSPTGYLAANLRPQDVVVVNTLSSWGFAYYWPHETPAIEPVTSNLQRFVAVFPDRPGILVATDRNQSAVDEVVGRAAALAAARGPQARIFYLHQHLVDSEKGFFAEAFAAHHLQVTPVQEGLDLVTPDGG